MGKLSENRKNAGRARREQVLRMLEANMTQAEIGVIMGNISRQRVNQMAQKGRRERETEPESAPIGRR